MSAAMLGGASEAFQAAQTFAVPVLRPEAAAVASRIRPVGRPLNAAATSTMAWPSGARLVVTACGTAAVALALAARRSSRSGRKVPPRHSKTAAASWDQELTETVFGKKKKTVIITGASSGLGLATAKELVKTGEWLVIMACRDFVKAEKAAKAAQFPKDNYKVLHLDLAANSSVRQFVASFRALGIPLDCLVCNAAVYFPNADKTGAILPGLFPGGGPRWSADGHELSFAANYLGHFLLVKLMMEDLQKSKVKPARCIILGTVTATVNDTELGGQIPPKADLGDLSGLEKGMKTPITMIDGKEFCGAKAYKDSKVCDVMMMRELHKRYHEKTGIVFTSMYPGCIAETGLFREHYPVFQRFFPDFQKSVTRAYVSEPEAGRRLALCVADEAYGTSGSYYSWQGASGTGGEGGMEGKDNTEKKMDWFTNFGSFRTLSCEEIGGEAGDDARCKRLWELSEKLVEA